MDGVILLQRAQETGLTVRIDGDRLVIRGPRQADQAARQLIARKAEVMAVLLDPPSAICEAWSAAISEVGRIWGRVKAVQGDATWLPPEVESRLDAEVENAAQTGDLQRAFQAIEEWRATWISFLQGPNSPANQERTS
jgi:hypothetical protein